MSALFGTTLRLSWPQRAIVAMLGRLGVENFYLTELGTNDWLVNLPSHDLEAVVLAANEVEAVEWQCWSDGERYDQGDL